MPYIDEKIISAREENEYMEKKTNTYSFLTR